MADFRDFFLEFIDKRALTKESSFTRDEVVAWFKSAHPDRKLTHIHHQLLKKTTNYSGRIEYTPTAGASDDLFFALDSEFRSFRLYRKDSDPSPYYSRNKSSEEQATASRQPVEQVQRVSHGVSIEPNAVYCADCVKLLERIRDEGATLIYLDPPFYSEDRRSAGQSEFHSLKD